MYAIPIIVYGYPISNNDIPIEHQLLPPAFQKVVDEDHDNEAFLIGGPNRETLAFGLSLGSFDEACAYVEIETLSLEPSEEQKAKVKELIKAQKPDVRKELDKWIEAWGEPSVFFFWTYS